MSTTGGTVAYWQRVLLPGGIVGTPGSTIAIPGPVHLLRNVAQVALVNNTADNTLSLTDVSFAVGNYFDRGSVAPYNTVSAAFGTGDPDADTPAADFITEARGGVPTAMTEADLAPVGTAIDIYERRNSTAPQQTFVIIRGKFVDESVVSENFSYYKIDIVDPEATALLDLRRNFRYIVRLNSVTHAGYSTLAGAVMNAAANNINAAVSVSEYTAISDGDDVLRVEASSFVYVRPGQSVAIHYSYIDGVTSATVNTGVDISLTQDDTQPVVALGTFDWQFASYEWSPGRMGAPITFTTAALPLGVDPYRASIRIAKGNLSRVVQLQLRQAMDFVGPRTTPADGVAGNTIGSPVGIHFTMPGNISASVFPIPIYITTKRFAPDPELNQLSVDVSDGNFRYVYYAGYMADGGEHTIWLVSNSPNTNETVLLSSPMFNPVSVRFY
jgi:hypothetical protein